MLTNNLYCASQHAQISFIPLVFNKTNLHIHARSDSVAATSVTHPVSKCGSMWTVWRPRSYDVISQMDRLDESTKRPMLTSLSTIVRHRGEYVRFECVPYNTSLEHRHLTNGTSDLSLRIFWYREVFSSYEQIIFCWYSGWIAHISTTFFG